VNEQSDPRSPLAVAALWLSQVTTVVVEMALPAFVGHWADSRWNTGALFLMLGSGVGLAVGMWHLLRMVAQTHSDAAIPRDPRRHDDRNEEP
jgi:ATP synthase protein I